MLAYFCIYVNIYKLIPGGHSLGCIFNNQVKHTKRVVKADAYLFLHIALCDLCL
jgi:hypothetical protein